MEMQLPVAIKLMFVEQRDVPVYRFYWYDGNRSELLEFMLAMPESRYRLTVKGAALKFRNRVQGYGMIARVLGDAGLWKCEFYRPRRRTSRLNGG